MNWSGCGIKTIALFLLFCSTAVAARAQDEHRGIKPDQLKLQFAGGIGFFSIGAGYHNRKETLEGDLFYGYVPASVGGVDIHSLTAKFTASPVRRVGHGSLQWKPLSLGVLFNYALGKEYFGFSPDNYPYEYYGFPTALHAGAFLGGALNKKLEGGRLKELGVYYEFITFDREFVSFWNNRTTIDISDVVNIGVGIRAGF